MRRVESVPRARWAERCESLGFGFHTDGRQAYWNEAVAYEFTAAEIDRLDAATRELHRICLLAVEHIVSHNLLWRVGVPAVYEKWVADSWRRRDPTLLGRFDLAYDGTSDPKLLEYNADTPTSLLETAVVQWYWLQETRDPSWDQFNVVHERLIARWREIFPQGSFVHIVGETASAEIAAQLRYLLDTLLQAGHTGKVIDISGVGVQNGAARFIDPLGRPISDCFKLYPWEWMFVDSFGTSLLSLATRFVEPPWKAILSTKALLPILWELFPGHPNLLPAFLSADPFKGAPYVIKPFHAREGEGISIVGLKTRCVTYGGLGPRIYQAYSPLFSSEGMHAVIGAWVVGDTPAGVCVRESTQLVTGSLSQFVPHAFR